MLTLHGDLLSSPTRAIALFCLVNEIDYQFNVVTLTKLEHRRPEFLVTKTVVPLDAAINPRGKVPAITDDGFNLPESATILRYLATTRSVPDHWYPADAKTRARVDAVLDWYHTDLRQTAKFVFGRVLQVNVFKLPPAKNEDVELYKQNMIASLDILEKEFLAEGPFLLGASKPSIADLLLACEVTQTLVLEKSELEALMGPRPKIRQWLKVAEDELAPHFHTVHSEIHNTVAFLEKMRNSTPESAL